MEDRVQLFSPGSLGTCWYGKYHYMEPWVGCAHACPYCYARTRAAVTNSLEDRGTTFEKPALLMERSELLREIERETGSGRLEILKLCRYTDIFTPEFVADGLALEILRILANSRVRRIILTTKGLPDEALIQLMIAHREKFSYNLAARPSCVVEGSVLAGFDAGLTPLEPRLEAGGRLAAAGVQTTVHMDPFVAGLDDADQALLPFLDRLKRHRLHRVMFSYLLFSNRIMPTMEAAVPAEALEEIMASYDFAGAHKVLPGQEETASYSLRNDVIRDSVEKTATILQERGFDFVLCSLKSVRGLSTRKFSRSMLCDGKFYA